MGADNTELSGQQLTGRRPSRRLMSCKCKRHFPQLRQKRDCIGDSLEERWSGPAEASLWAPLHARQAAPPDSAVPVWLPSWIDSESPPPPRPRGPARTHRGRGQLGSQLSGGLTCRGTQWLSAFLLRAKEQPAVVTFLGRHPAWGGHTCGPGPAVWPSGLGCRTSGLQNRPEGPSRVGHLPDCSEVAPAPR